MTRQRKRAPKIERPCPRCGGTLRLTLLAGSAFCGGTYHGDEYVECWLRETTGLGAVVRDV